MADWYDTERWVADRFGMQMQVREPRKPYTAPAIESTLGIRIRRELVSHVRVVAPTDSHIWDHYTMPKSADCEPKGDDLAPWTDDIEMGGPLR